MDLLDTCLIASSGKRKPGAAGCGPAHKNFTETTFDDASAVILAPEAFTVYRSPQAFMSVNVVSNLQVQVAIYGFMATIAKMPYGIIKYAKA